MKLISPVKPCHPHKQSAIQTYTGYWKQTYVYLYTAHYEQSHERVSQLCSRQSWANKCVLSVSALSKGEVRDRVPKWGWKTVP